MSFETKVVFNSTISFRDKAAASRFLDSLAVVVEQAVAVFHGHTQRHATLERELQSVAGLLHHFEDSIERGGPDDSDLEVAQGAAAAAGQMIRRVLEVLQAGPRDGVNGWSDEQREHMANSFKELFEHLVVLMQLSERQQAKGLIKNIRLTLGMLNNVCSTSNRTALLHNENLRNALPVIVRAAANRAEVAQDLDLKRQLEEIRQQLAQQSTYFVDWVQANNEHTNEIVKRERSFELERALYRLLNAVEIRITSSADFGYNYINRLKFESNLDDLLRAARSKDKAKVVEAARAITEVVKEVEAKELDENSALKKDARELLSQAQLALDGTENQLEMTASRMKQEIAVVVEKEQEIKGKPLLGTLPNAIQSMAALLKSREAQNAKPKQAGGSTAYGSKKEEAKRAKDELPARDAPAMNVIAKVQHNN